MISFVFILNLISRHFHFRSRRKTADVMRLPLQFYFMYLFYCVLSLKEAIDFYKLDILPGCSVGTLDLALAAVLVLILLPSRHYPRPEIVLFSNKFNGRSKQAA